MDPDEFLRWNVLFLMNHLFFFPDHRDMKRGILVYNINQQDFDGDH